MPTEAEFLATILDRHYAELQAGVPFTDGPRLVFADWLEEHGECAHSEFIRVQCELALVPLCGHAWVYDYPQGCRRCRLSRRERELLNDFDLEILPVIDGLTRHNLPSLGWHERGSTDPARLFRADLGRGFVAAVTLPRLTDWLALGPRLVRSCPLELVHAGDKSPYCHSARWGWWLTDGTGPAGGFALPRPLAAHLKSPVLAPDSHSDRRCMPGQMMPLPPCPAP